MGLHEETRGKGPNNKCPVRQVYRLTVALNAVRLARTPSTKSWRKRGSDEPNPRSANGSAALHTPALPSAGFQPAIRTPPLREAAPEWAARIDSWRIPAVSLAVIRTGCSSANVPFRSSTCPPPALGRAATARAIDAKGAVALPTPRSSEPLGETYTSRPCVGAAAASVPSSAAASSSTTRWATALNIVRNLLMERTTAYLEVAASVSVPTR